MVLLALETVTRRGSLALVTGEACGARTGAPDRTHGERLPGDAMALLSDHGLSLADVDRFAIVAGPGSFTGLRVGMASVQGLALVTGRQVTPIPTLAAIAEGWRAASRDRIPPEGVVLVACLDGQRGDVFFGGWLVSGDEPIERARVAIEPSVGSADALVRSVEALATGHPAIVAGIDMERHAERLAPFGIEVEQVPGILAEMAGAIAMRNPGLGVPPHALRPIYIRRPDAELARERAGLGPR